MNNRRKQLMLASAKEYCKCVVEGKTLKYNNQCNFIQSNTTGSGTNTSVLNGVLFIQCASGNRGAIRNVNIVSGHKYLVTFKVKPNYNGNVRAILFNSAYATNFEATFNLTKDIYSSCSFLGNATSSDNNSNISFYIDFGETFDSSKNIEIISLMIIDLTTLDLDNITSVSDFFATDLGKYIAKGNDLPYEQNGKFIHAQTPIKFKGRNLLSLNRTQGTLSGNSYTSQRTFKENEYYLGISMDNYYYEGNITSFSKTYDSVTLEIINYGYGVGFPVRVSGGKQYRIYGKSSNIIEYRIGWYDKNGNFISYTDFQDTFTAPQNAYWCNIVIAPSYLNTETTFSDIIFCEESEYQNKYEPNCDTKVLEGITLHKGYTYKTYSIDEITYNNFCYNGNFENSSNWDNYGGTLTIAHNEGTLTITSPANSNRLQCEATIQSGHKYILSFYANCDTTTHMFLLVNSVSIADDILITQNLKEQHSIIFTATESGTLPIRFYCNREGAYLQNGNKFMLSKVSIIDLTALGLENVNSLDDFKKTKLGMFLSKGYSLSFATSNNTIKDQLVKTFKEIDLSDLTWTSEDVGMVAQLPSDFKTFEGNELASVIAEKYKTAKYYDEIQDSICIADVHPYGYSVVIRYGNTTPSGKALLELATPEIITDYPMDFVLSNDNLSYDDSIFGNNGTIFKLPNGLIPVLENGIPKLEIIGDEIGFVGIEYGNTPYPSQEDVYYANGFRMSENEIAFNTTNSDGSNVNNYDEREYLVGKTLRVWVTTPRDIPDIMVSRRTINVESENEIDLDFAKE